MKNELLDRLNDKLTFLTSLSRTEVKELFDEVNDFVKKNYLCDGEDEKYYLKYNDTFYEVGYFYGPEILYYVRIIQNGEDINKYVDYENMKNNTLTDNENEIKSLFNDINSDVNRLKEKGASLRLLNKSFNIWR